MTLMSDRAALPNAGDRLRGDASFLGVAMWRMRSAGWLVAVAALLALSILAVDPSGDFPLNDDWSFVRSARTLMVAHDWRPAGWAGMTQLTHAMFGAFTCSVSSCSYEALRTATLATGFALALSCFCMFRSLGIPRVAVVVAVIAIVFDPVLYPLMFSFMTDVPFELMMVVAAAASISALRTGSWRSILLSAMLITLATLSRQLGLALAVAFLTVYPLLSREDRVPRIAKAALPLAIAATAFLAYEVWMRQTGRAPAIYDEKYAGILAGLASPLSAFAQALRNLIVSGLYLGLICLPVLLLRPVGGREVLKSPSGRIATYGGVLAVAVMLANQRLMPLLGNVVTKAGIGPFTLRDTYILGLPNVPELPVGFWLTVTGLGLAGLWLLIFHLSALAGETLRHARRGPVDRPTGIRLFALCCIALYLMPLLLTEVYDRYLGPVVPLVCLVLLPSAPLATRQLASKRGILAGLAAAGLALVSVLGAHDDLAWNRARWQAIADVEQRGEAGPATLDGGFEYNGERGYDPRAVADPAKSWWWIKDDILQIAFGPIPGTEVLRRYPYRTWLPIDMRSILVLRRLPSEMAFRTTLAPEAPERPSPAR